MSKWWLCCLALVFASCQPSSTPSESDDVGKHIRELESWFASARSEAARALGWSKDSRAVEPLIAALKDRDRVVRYEAAKALGEITDPRAVEPLIGAMEEGDRGLRRVIVESLVKIGPPAVLPLTSVLKDPKARGRIEAVIVLGQLKDPRAVEPLAAALRDSSRDYLPRHIAWALASIGVPAVEALLVSLKDGKPDVRCATAWALGEIKDGRAIRPLAATLEDKNHSVRQAAAEALQKGGYEPATQLQRITLLVAAKNWAELVNIGAPAAESLIAVLKDDYYIVRRDAAKALGDIRDARSAGPLATALRAAALTSTHEDRAMAEALVKIGAPAAKPLVPLLIDKEPFVQSAAKDTLLKIGLPSVEPLLVAATDRDYHMRMAANDVLAGLATQLKTAPPSYASAQTFELLFAALKDTDRVIRESAARTLAIIKDARALEPLAAALLNDSDMSVCRTAAYALGEINDTRAIEPLIAGAKSNKGAASDAVHFALRRIGAPAVKPLAVALRSDDARVREMAARTLIAIGTPAVESVLAALSDKETCARRAMAKALVTLEPIRVVEQRQETRDKKQTPVMREARATRKQASDLSSIAGVLSRRAPTPVLAKIKEAGAIEPLIVALKDSDPETRHAAAEALLSIDVLNVDTWLAALKDSDVNVRLVAADALVKINDPRAVEPLIAALRDSSSSVCAVAARGLSRLHDRRAIEPLVAALPDWWAQKAIGNALASLGWEPRTEREQAYWKLCRRKTAELDNAWEQIRRVLQEDLRSGDERRIDHAVFTSICIGREEMVPEVIRALNQHGHGTIAAFCRNCGHPALQQTAQLWIEMNGYPSFILKVPWGVWRSAPPQK